MSLLFASVEVERRRYYVELAVRCFFFHGFGSSGLQAQAHCVGGLKFASAEFPDGIEPDLLSGHRRWFPFSTNENELSRHIHDATCIVEDWLRRRLESQGGSRHEAIAVAGHSQGGMIALHLFQRQRLNVIEADIFAAFLPPLLHYCHAAHHTSVASVRRVVTLYASTRDKFVSADKIALTYAYLSRADPRFSVQQYLTDALDHDFNSSWLDRELFFEVSGTNVGGSTCGHY